MGKVIIGFIFIVLTITIVWLGVTTPEISQSEQTQDIELSRFMDL